MILELGLLECLAPRKYMRWNYRKFPKFFLFPASPFAPFVGSANMIPLSRASSSLFPFRRRTFPLHCGWREQSELCFLAFSDQTRPHKQQALGLSSGGHEDMDVPNANNRQNLERKPQEG